MQSSQAAAGSGLLDWVDAPVHGRGVRTYSRSDASWTFTPYHRLADRVRGVSEQLRRDGGVTPGELIAVVERDCISFLSTFFGVLHAGAAVLPIPAPEAPGGDSPDHARRIVKTTSPTRLVGSVATIRAANSWASPEGLSSMELEDYGAKVVPRGEPGRLALVQFTSGSTAPSRGVQITRVGLEAQVRMLRAWLDVRPSDGVATWLPWHHDMGLVGTLITAVCGQMPIWHMRPRDFLLNPVVWLECLGGAGATITAAPGFGYGYVARNVTAEMLGEVDFSGWRSAIAGAERLSASALVAFAKLLEPHGFQAEALRPAYGLAEATLAVTGHPMGQSCAALEVDAGAIRFGVRPTIIGERRLDEVAATRGDALVVTAGRALAGVELSIVDAQGAPVPIGAVGEIVVRTPAMAAGYVGLGSGSKDTFRGDELVTGDAGFLTSSGDLMVLGRIGDSLKTRGRTVYAEGLETVVAAALDISPSRCVVLCGANYSAPEVAAVIETGAPERAAEAGLLLRSQVGPSVAISVYLAGPGAILWTTSGKPKRRLMLQRLVSGTIDVRLAWSSDRQGHPR